MRPVALSICLLVLTFGTVATPAALPMRPYSGIGVVRISAIDPTWHLTLYDEPGLIRSGTLQQSAVSGLTSWLFGPGPDRYLVVTARKGDWLRVVCDEAGREAWLQQSSHRVTYRPWEQFLKGKTITFLRNAPPKFFTLHAQPAAGVGHPFTATAPMKVILVQNDWCYVLFGETQAGWIRWRDHDGRLLIGLAPHDSAQSR